MEALLFSFLIGSAAAITAPLAYGPGLGYGIAGQGIGGYGLAGQGLGAYGGHGLAGQGLGAYGGYGLGGYGLGGYGSHIPYAGYGVGGHGLYGYGGSLGGNSYLAGSGGAHGGYGNSGFNGQFGNNRYAGHQQGLGAFSAGDNGANLYASQGGNRLLDRYEDTSAGAGFHGAGALGHNKGHKSTGFHKSYSNVETGKNINFVDEDHDSAHRGYGQVFDDASLARFGNGYRGVDQSGLYGNQLNHHLASNNGLAGGAFQGAGYGGAGAAGYSGAQGHHLANQQLAGYGAQGLGYGHGIGLGYGAPLGLAY